MIIKQKKSKSRIAAWFVLIVAWAGLIGFTVKYFMDQGNKQPTVNNPTNALVSNGNTELVDETPITEEKKIEYTVPATHPRYISVPELGINKARVVPLNIVKATNQLDAPVSIYDAGWYTGSSKPESNGSGALLMDGHNGGPNFDGIFKKLGKLSVGGKIIIERGDGQIFTYEVKDSRDMLVSDINDPKNPFGMSTMLNSIEEGKQGLNIITCVGQWNDREKTYDSRVMLRAVQV